VDKLLEEIEQLGIDLVIMGSHAPGFLSLLIGSTTKGVMRGARCPVLVLPPAKA
jgi:universal stress protein F